MFLNSFASHGSSAPRRRAAGGDIVPGPEAYDQTETAPPAPAGPRLESFADLVALAAEKRDVMLKIALEDAVEPVRFKQGHVELHLLPDAPKDIANDLGRKLKHWTGDRWMVSLTEERGERPLGEVRREREARMLEEARRHPSVKSIMTHFPDAVIVSVRELNSGPKTTKKD